MKSFNRNDHDVKDQILRYLRAVDTDSLLTIEVERVSPALDVTLSYKEFDLTSKKLSLVYDFYSIYVTDSDETWIRQSVSRIKKIQKLKSLKQVDLVNVDDLISQSMKASGFLETRSNDRMNRYEIFITFDEVEVATTVTKFNASSTISSRSHIRMHVTDSVESDFDEFEKIVLSAKLSE